MSGQPVLQKLLSQRLADIRLRNPSYSLRAFAKKAGVSSSAISEILNGKRRISKNTARRIALRLSLDPQEAATLLASFPEKRPYRKESDPPEQPPLAQLSMDQFRLISEWWHFAIQSLSETEDYRHDPAWVASRLGLSPQQARSAMERLSRLRMLWSDEAGKVLRGAPGYETSDDIADASLRHAHSQNLELARKSLESDPVLQRDFTATTMAIDPDKLPEAKRRIREFHNELCAFLESGDKREVHKICIQMFPLTRPAAPSKNER